MKEPIMRSQRGVSFIELLVALAVFVLLILTIDAVFAVAQRSSRQAELAAEVGQSARAAADRLTREIRESGATAGDIVTVADVGVVFRSARPEDDSTLFCVNVDGGSEPLYHSECNYYGGPPVANVEAYFPVWQRYIGYVLNADGEIVRYSADLSSPGASLAGLVGTIPAGASSAVVATAVTDFNVSGPANGRVTVTIQLEGTETVQGSAVPPQRIVIETTVLVRNASSP